MVRYTCTIHTHSSIPVKPYTCYLCIIVLAWCIHCVSHMSCRGKSLAISLVSVETFYISVFLNLWFNSLTISFFTWCLTISYLMSSVHFVWIKMSMQFLFAILVNYCVTGILTASILVLTFPSSKPQKVPSADFYHLTSLVYLLHIRKKLFSFFRLSYELMTAEL